MIYDIAVVGGGAAGIFAALTAAKYNANVCLLEKNSRIGKKILMTGNGRCNLTNRNLSVDKYNSDFVKFAIESFTAEDTISAFMELGMLSKTEEEGRVYPISGQASAVLDVLLLGLKNRNVSVFCDFSVIKINKKNGIFKIQNESSVIEAKKIIVATGGMAAPKTGSDGYGYKLLKSFGHTVTEPTQALTKLKTDKGITGVRADAKVTLNGRTQRGELQFVENGLSGIPIFNLSAYAKKGDKIIVDLLPDYDRKTLVDFLKAKPSQAMETLLVGITNKQLGQTILKEANLGKLSRNNKDLTDKEFAKIVDLLKSREFTVLGKMSWDNAQVTRGGISLSEINNKTMESKLMKNVFVVGELLDVDAECGGYNLQWAWASGYLAGKTAAENN